MELFDIIDLKTYASTEWLFADKKRYKTVFERYWINFIYAEFSFYNLHYKRADWEMELTLRFFSLKSEEPKLLATLFLKKLITKDEPTVYMREGWGNKDMGVFWGRGEYKCVIEVKGEIIKEKIFYVEDGWKQIGLKSKDEIHHFEEEWTFDNLQLGKARTNEVEAEPKSTEVETETPKLTDVKDTYNFLFGENPYFEVASIRLFESNYEQNTDIVYTDTFEQQHTRYIYTELCLKNKLTDRDWRGEFKLIYENAGGEIKGEVYKITTVTPSENAAKVIFGWGSDTKGSWYPSENKAKVVFQDKIITTVDFVVV